jgi:alpha-galactosidase
MSTALGMEFGLWWEPEMVNPDSNLYRAHPDWAINFPGRPRSEGRNQLMLNLAREDVKEYLFNVFDKTASRERYQNREMGHEPSHLGAGLAGGSGGGPEADLGQVRE